MPSLEEIQAKFGAEIDETSFRDNRRLIVPSPKVFSLLAWLKDQGFNMLVDVTAVDYLEYPGATDRFHVVYAL